MSASSAKPKPPPSAKPAQPELSIVPDNAQGKHPKAGSATCGATRNYAGKIVHCVLPLMHAGNHNKGGIWWRPSSGDDS